MQISADRRNPHHPENPGYWIVVADKQHEHRQHRCVFGGIRMGADHFIQAVCGIGIRPNNRSGLSACQGDCQAQAKHQHAQQAVQTTAVIIGYSSCSKKFTESGFIMLFCVVLAMSFSGFPLIFQAEYEKQ